MPTPACSILIVDDQANNLRILLDVLQEHLFKIYIADSGERALEVLAKVEPDIILLDVMLPGMDGFETCRRIKATPQWRAIPVLFMTALDGTEDKLSGFAVGGVDYITKPFQQAEVVARVNTHIALRRRERELQEALDEIKQLRTILPICAGCKKIRDDQGYWSQVEAYLSAHTDIEFTHSICPDCARIFYPELYPDEAQ